MNSSRTLDELALMFAPACEEQEEPRRYEAVRRRRQQYRQYQHRRRTQQQARTLTLEQDVRSLTLEIAALQSPNTHLFFSRGTAIGAPASRVAAFFQVYAHGSVARQRASQDAFLRTMMASDVRGPDFTGVDALAQQWYLYEELFVQTCHVPRRTTVVPVDATTLVIVDVQLTIRPNRRGAACLCPRIGGDELLMLQLLTNAITVHGSVRFEFDRDGLVTGLAADMDFVGGLVPVLGSLERVNACTEHTRLSLSTGFIAVDQQPPLQHSSTAQQPPPSHHSVQFLLS